MNFKVAFLYFLFLFICLDVSFSQNDRSHLYILIPHPRSEDKVHQSVLPSIEKIDFSKFEMILLGGDLTWYTSINRTSMDYCDSLFHLGSTNTLWSLGNHDLNSRSLITEYTGRPCHYSFYKNGITFVILDTELNASGFSNSFILNDQLEMMKDVCDTISQSSFLILMHHRLLWMIGNEDFSSRIDSVGESTRQLDTTNFYQDIFPLLQKVRNKGKQVICLGGDKSKINIVYSPEDSITFYAGTMAPEFPDSINNVLALNHDINKQILTIGYVSLSLIEKKVPVQSPFNLRNENSLKIWQSLNSGELFLQFTGNSESFVPAQIYSINGTLKYSLMINGNNVRRVCLDQPGVYILRIVNGKETFARKIVLF